MTFLRQHPFVSFGDLILLAMSGAGDRPMLTSRRPQHIRSRRRSSSRRRADQADSGRGHVLGRVRESVRSRIVAPSHRARIPPMSQDDRGFRNAPAIHSMQAVGRIVAHDRPRRSAGRGGGSCPIVGNESGSTLSTAQITLIGPHAVQEAARSPHPNIGRSSPASRSRPRAPPHPPHQPSPLRRSAPPGPQWQPTSGRRHARNRPQHRSQGDPTQSERVSDHDDVVTLVQPVFARPRNWSASATFRIGSPVPSVMR